jgi:Fe2+ or Zn2+ uptake regulation protein
VIDLDLPHNAAEAFPLPRGFKINQFEVAAHGVCSACGARQKK